MEFKYDIPEQLEKNSKLIIRSQECEIESRTHKDKRFYYIIGGRDLLIKTNLITRESPYIHRTENTPHSDVKKMNLTWYTNSHNQMYQYGLLIIIQLYQIH